MFFLYELYFFILLINVKVIFFFKVIFFIVVEGEILVYLKRFIRGFDEFKFVIFLRFIIVLDVFVIDMLIIFFINNEGF